MSKICVALTAVRIVDTCIMFAGGIISSSVWRSSYLMSLCQQHTLAIGLCIQLCSWHANAQTNNVTVSGYLVDSEGQPVGFSVVSSSVDTVFADDLGLFSLRVSTDDTVKIVSSMHVDTVFQAQVWQNGSSLVLRPLTLAAVVVSSARYGLERPNFYLRPAQLAALPALGGQVDILRSLKQLPGVSGEAEGTASISIRGGEPSQTLLLLDAVPVFSPSIFFGYVGTINYHMVRDISVYTSGFSPELGGRASGFVDVKSKKGRSDRHHRRVSIGFPSADIQFDGPLGRASYILAARGSYLAVPALFQGSAFLQGDVHSGVDWSSKRGDHYSIRLFRNQSSLGFTNEDGAAEAGRYGNSIGMISSSSDIGRWSIKSTGFLSDYRSVNAYDDASEDISFASQYTTLAAKSRAIYQFGSGFTGLVTSELSSRRSRALSDREADNERILLTSNERGYMGHIGSSILYSNEDQGFFWRVGLRSSFMQLFGRNGLYATLEPRVKLEFSHAAWTSGISVDRLVQDVHVLGSVTGGGTLERYALPTADFLPPSMWQLSTTHRFKPESSTWIDLNLSPYMKFVNNQIIDLSNLFASGTSLQDLAIRSSYVAGRARGWGVDVQSVFQFKAVGSLRVSYSLSGSQRRGPGVNRDMWYRYRWNRLHSVNLIGVLPISASNWSLTGAFTYQSGYPFTYPVAITGSGLQGIEGPTPVYTSRNNRISSAAHRLDLSATYHKELNFGRSITWNLSLYNVYGRQNPTATHVDLETASTDNVHTDMYDLIVRTRSLFRWIPGIQMTYEW